MHSRLTTVILVSLLRAAALDAHTEPEDDETCSPVSYFDGRVVTPEELEETVVPKSAKPWWTIGWPCRKIYGGMESGLIKFEKTKLREKIYDWQRKLAEAGFRPLFGGLGEGSGIGLGTIYDYPHRTTEALHAMVRWAFLSGYQEFSLNFDPKPFAGATFDVAVDYQWRPEEPYYGHGRDSRPRTARALLCGKVRSPCIGIRSFTAAFEPERSTRLRR